MKDPNKAIEKIILLLITSLLINLCALQSSVFPVLFGTYSNPTSETRFWHLDYNQA